MTNLNPHINRVTTQTAHLKTPYLQNSLIMNSFFILRAVQALFAFLVLCLAAAGIAKFSDASEADGYPDNVPHPAVSFPALNFSAYIQLPLFG
jgi:hypothetical protein